MDSDTKGGGIIGEHDACHPCCDRLRLKIVINNYKSKTVSP